MADKDLGLTLTYQPSVPTTVAEDYSDRETALRRARLLANPDLNPPPALAAEEPAPEVPGRQAATPRAEQEGPPSPTIAGLEAGVQAVRQGVSSVMQGVGRLPEAPMQGMRQVILEGVMPTLMAPLTGAFAVGGQGLENLSPETANTELFDASTAAWLRTMLLGKAPKELTPEERQAFNRPMTVRDALETLGPMLAPMLKQVGTTAKVAGKATIEVGKAGAAALAEEYRRAPERGSVEFGAREGASAYGGRPMPEGAARPAPVEFKGYQELPPSRGGGHWELWNLTEDIPGHPKGSTMTRQTLERLGYTVPEARGAPGAPPSAPSPFQKPTPPAGAEARVNLGRIDATESVRQTLADLNKFAGERLAEHRKPQTHAQTIAESQAARWTLEQMLSHEPETILVDKAKALKLRDTAVAAAEYYDRLGQLAEAGDAAAIAKLTDAFAVAVKLAALDEAQGRNLARGLEMRKEAATSTRAAKVAGPEKILEVSRKLGEAEQDPLQAYRRVQALRPEQRRGFFRTVYEGFRAGRDIFHAAWINALLSNPRTHTANLTATGLVVAGDIPETMIAGWVNRLLFRDPQGVQRGEATIKLRSLGEAYNDGIRLMAQAWRTGEEPFGTGKLTEHPRISAGAYGFDTGTVFGRAIDVMGSTLQSRMMPTRALVAEDAFMKGIVYRMEVNALALRQALSEGKEGPALARRVGELQQQPMAWMIEAAQDQATLLTLNRELGSAGRAFTAGANAIPLGRVLFPFLRTPGNSIKYVGQRAPFISLLSYQNWQDVLAGGAARDKAIARTLMGHAVGAAIAYNVSNGTITGGGSKNKNLAALQRDPRTSTKPPYSICPEWTDECYGYSRLDPVGAYIGMIADYVELAEQIPDQDAFDEWAAYGEAVIVAAGKASVNKTWLIGLSNVIDSIKDPNTQGGKMVNSFATSLVPAGVRALTREMDDNTIREVRGLSDAIRSGLPFLAEELPAKRNPVTGEKVQTPPGWIVGMFSPVTVTKRNQEKLFQEIQFNEVTLPPFPDYLGGAKPAEGPQMEAQKGTPGVKLSREQKQRGIDLQTEAKRNGKTLYEALTALVETMKYNQQSTGPDGGRAMLIKAVYHEYQENAKLTLQRTDTELRAAIRQQLETRTNKLRPVTSPKSPQFGGAGDLIESLMR